MRTFSFESNGTKIYCYAWENAVSPKGTALLVHDFADHAERYDDLAMFLNANGYNVVAPDLRGHGKTCGSYDKRGEVDNTFFADTIEDIYRLASWCIAEMHLPLVMVAMGVGTVFAQAYLTKYSSSLMGVALLGAVHMKRARTKLLGACVGVQIGFVDGHSPADWVQNAMMRAYSKPFATERVRFGWLSRDKEEIKKYIADPFCGAQFTMSLYFMQNLFRSGGMGLSPRRLAEIPADMPIWIAYGEKDSMGKMGELPREIHEQYVTHGKKQCRMKGYPDGRHDLLHDLVRDEVYLDLLQFLNRCVG